MSGARTSSRVTGLESLPPPSGHAWTDAHADLVLRTVGAVFALAARLETETELLGRLTESLPCDPAARRVETVRAWAERLVVDSGASIPDVTVLPSGPSRRTRSARRR